jgi:glucokinase
MCWDESVPSCDSEPVAPYDLTIGVDVGGTKILGVALDARGQVEAELRVRTPPTGDALVSSVVDMVAGLRPAGSRAPIGVGAPGLVDLDGVLRFAPHLPAMAGLPIRDAIEARLPGSWVRCDNDASCAGWAEHLLGAGRGRRDLLLVALGTGIGGGMVTGGRLLEGANGFAGEIGHMVVDPSGPHCPCGQKGCWERFASGSALGRLGREAAEAGRVPRIVELAGGDAGAVRGEDVTQAAAEGDAGAMEVMSTFAWWLALGLANLANIFDPTTIVIAGGLVAAGQALLEPARMAFAGLVEAVERRPPVAIVPAQLGPRAGAVGAALLARGAPR